MEPTILLIGKNTSSLEILRDELIKFDRKILIANSNEQISKVVKSESIDFAILGAGLPDDLITAMGKVIKEESPSTEIHVMEKLPGLNPTSMIGYTNEKAIMWKLMRAMKKG